MAGQAAVTEVPVENGGLVSGSSLPGHGHEHGLLALGDVPADRLAGPGRVAEHSEDVVTELEGDAKRRAVAGESAGDRD